MAELENSKDLISVLLIILNRVIRSLPTCLLILICIPIVWEAAIRSRAIRLPT